MGNFSNAWFTNQEMLERERVTGICESCQWWNGRMLIKDLWTDRDVVVGHCEARTIGGLTAEDYSCGEHTPKEDKPS